MRLQHDDDVGTLSPRRRRRRARRRRRWYRSLRLRLERAGPAFIKWGQWASTRFDRFPPALCAQLQRLQQRAPQHDWDWSKQTLERSFGPGALSSLASSTSTSSAAAPAAAASSLGGAAARGAVAAGGGGSSNTSGGVFEWVEETPIASGSIAQVHRAKLRQDWMPPTATALEEGEEKEMEGIISGALKRWSAAAEWTLKRGGWRTAAAARAGSIVAVKVRHPGVEQAINVDFLILEFAAKCLHVFSALRDLQTGSSSTPHQTAEVKPLTR